MAEDRTLPSSSSVASDPRALADVPASAPQPAKSGPIWLAILTLGFFGRSKDDVHAPPNYVSRIDSAREVVETIVFVVVLVLLLKSFVAEAFVIPTGSMATTLLGYQKQTTCEQCGHLFP